MDPKQTSTESKFKCNSVTDDLETYYSAWDIEDDQLMTFLHEVYQDIPACGTLLDIGGGPTIHQHISARKKVEKITFAGLRQTTIRYCLQLLRS